MPTSAYHKFSGFPDQLLSGYHTFGINTYKLLFTNTPPDPVMTFPGWVTEITPGNGYPAGGLTVPTTTRLGGDATCPFGGVKATDVTLTATGPIGPFQYVILYDDTSAANYFVCWWDYGSPLTLANGDTFTVDFQDNLLFVIT